MNGWIRDVERPLGIILVIASTKGGVGKTTMALSLAVAATEGQVGWPKDLSVVCVDSDNQQSLAKLIDIREVLTSDPDCKLHFTPLEVETVFFRKSATNYMAKLEGLAKRYDLVIVDTPGYDAAELALALEVADMAVIPCDPSAMGEEGISDVLETLATTMRNNRQLTPIVVPNRVVDTVICELSLENLRRSSPIFDELNVIYDPENPVCLQGRNRHMIAPDISEMPGREADRQDLRWRVQSCATALEKSGHVSGRPATRRDWAGLTALLLDVIKLKLGVK